MCTYCHAPCITINNEHTPYCRDHFHSCSCCAIPCDNDTWLCKACSFQERQFYETRVEMLIEMKRRGFNHVQSMLQINAFIPTDIRHCIEEYIVASVSTYNAKGKEYLQQIYDTIMPLLRKKNATKARRMWQLLYRGPLQRKDVDLIKFLLKHAHF